MTTCATHLFSILLQRLFDYQASPISEYLECATRKGLMKWECRTVRHHSLYLRPGEEVCVSHLR